MPASHLTTAALVGLDAHPVEVEIDISPGLHSFTIVGLPDTSVQEAKERVSSALKNSGFTPPRRSHRITVNLAPAGLAKQGPAYDLPIAVGFLLSSDQLKQSPDNSILMGELSLNGQLRPIKGVLPVAILAKKLGRKLILPQENAQEASLVKGLEVLPVDTLDRLVRHLYRTQPIKPFKPGSTKSAIVDPDYSFATIKGQEQAKRALLIAASGGHNILLSGPPGSGKTLLAKSLPDIMPDLTTAESLEVTKIYSISGQLPDNNPLITRRPFRSPHHTASTVSLIGGGRQPNPGEITLAHHGVLFLDEFPEFSRTLLESLRQPLQDRVVTVSRANYNLEFPANFTLVAAMNPCPCGYATDPDHQCSCTAARKEAYCRKLSGPLLDRIDIHVDLPPVPYRDLLAKQPADPTNNQTSMAIKKQVSDTRTRQYKRSKATNAALGHHQIEALAQLDKGARSLVENATVQLKLSARSYHKVLRVARTIADLDDTGSISQTHLAEALLYRPSQPKGY